MKMKFWLLLIFPAVGLSDLPRVSAEVEEFVVADFDSAQLENNLGRKIEVWLAGDGSDPGQSCQMSFSKDDALGQSEGHSAQLDYDVDSPNPAYNGIRTDLTGFDATGYRNLNFYAKGDRAKGFSSRFKIELIQAGKPPSPKILEGVRDEWQKFSVPLSEFWGVIDWTKLEKFVVVFADITNDPKTGTIYIDHVSFSK